MNDRRQLADMRRREAYPWRKWYFTKAWKRRRAEQLRKAPWCESCKRLGLSRLAKVADHVEPHRGDREKFFKGKLQSLCSGCHDSAKQREERQGFSLDVGADGWPVDPKHPFNSPGVVSGKTSRLRQNKRVSESRPQSGQSRRSRP